MPLAPRLAAPLLVAFAVTAGACGATVQRPDGLLPSTAVAAAASLEGDWRVHRWDDAFDGVMRFRGGQVVAETDGVLYFGTWQADGSDGNAHHVTLRLDSASVQGIRQVYARPTEVTLTLAFASSNALFALQSDGVWTRWTRERDPADESAP